MAVTLSVVASQVTPRPDNAQIERVLVSVIAKWTNGEYSQPVPNYGGQYGALYYTDSDGKFQTVQFEHIMNQGQKESGQDIVFNTVIDFPITDDITRTVHFSAEYAYGTVEKTELGYKEPFLYHGSTFLTVYYRDRESIITIPSTIELRETVTVAVEQVLTNTTHTIQWVCGTESGYICQSSDVLAFVWCPGIELARQNTTGTNIPAQVTITTYLESGSVVGTQTANVTLAIPSDVKPSVSLAVTENTNHKATYGKYIQGVSDITVTLTPTIVYDSPIQIYRTILEGYSFTDPTFTKTVVRGTTQTVSATVKDMRGRTSDAATAQYAVYAYSRPKITALSVHRCNVDGTENEFGEYVKVIFSASVTSLDGQNSATYTLGYKKSAESIYTDVSLSTIQRNYDVTDYSYIFAADTGSSYDVQICVEDNFFTGEKNTSVSTATTLMHWKANGLGMGIGKMAELDNVFDIGWQTRFTGGTLPVVLIPDTDLNTLTIPNTYVGWDILFNRYLNTPIDDGAFCLDVVNIGDGRTKQRFSNDTRVFERFYTEGAWGSWFCTSEYHGTLLWEGNEVMGGTDIITLAEPISKQNAGVVLVFCESGQFYRKQCRFIPKLAAMTLDVNEATGLTGHVFQFVSQDMTYFANKFLHIADTKIQGAAINDTTGTSDCGITYTNNKFKLCYVIGV